MHGLEMIEDPTVGIDEFEVIENPAASIEVGDYDELPANWKRHVGENGKAYYESPSPPAPVSRRRERLDTMNTKKRQENGSTNEKKFILYT